MTGDNCRWSFDDLHQAAHSRRMTDQEKQRLYALGQNARNIIVQGWADRAAWQTENRIGSNGIKYTAFWKGGESDESTLRVFRRLRRYVRPS